MFTEKKNPIISFIKLHNEIFFQISYALFAFLIIFCVFITCKDLYIKEKASDLTINMEIISPLLSDQDYKQLRANFYSIDSKKDYDDFRVSMGKFAIGLSKFHKLKISDKEKLRLTKAFLDFNESFEDLMQRNIIKDAYIWK